MNHSLHKYETEQYFYHPDHLGSSSFITDAHGEGYQHLQYLPFGETSVSQKLSSWSTAYQFSAKEKDDETGFSYFGARYYNSDVGVWLSVDPMADMYPNVSPYVYTYNSPINYIDPSGMNSEDPPSSHKLTGSKNLLVYINEPDVPTDLKAMHERSGNYDFVTVDNINQVQGIMESHYGKGNEPTIEHLVIRSHGVTNADNANKQGPDLDNRSGQGVVHNPWNSKGLIYLRGLLSNEAEIVFTACNLVFGYTDDSKGLRRSSRSLARNYSAFFLKGTNRNLFLNWATSDSRSITTNGQAFRFNGELHQSTYGGFIQFYYNSSGVWSKNDSFYDLTVTKNGAIVRTTIRPLTEPGAPEGPIILKKKF